MHKLIIRIVPFTGQMNSQYFNFDLTRDGTVWTLAIGRNWQDGMDYGGWDGQTTDPAPLVKRFIQLLGTKINKAEKDFLASKTLANFYTSMKTILPKTEVVVDHASVKALAGEAKYKQIMESTSFVLFDILTQNPTGIFRTIEGGFKTAVPDDMVRGVVAEAMHKLTIRLATHTGQMNSQYFDLSFKRDGTSWTLTVGRNWQDGMDYGGWDGQTTDPAPMVKAFINLLGVKTNKAAADFLASKSLANFYSTMKGIVGQTEVVVDVDSIKALPGETKYKQLMEATPFVVFDLLSQNPTGIFRTIQDGFRGAIKDDLSREAAASGMNKLIVHIIKKSAPFNAGYFDFVFSKEGKVWTVTVGRDWNDGMDYGGWDGQTGDPTVVTKQLLDKL